jgi:hypothetical protein
MQGEGLNPRCGSGTKDGRGWGGGNCLVPGTSTDFTATFGHGGAEGHGQLDGTGYGSGYGVASSGFEGGRGSGRGIASGSGSLDGSGTALH